MKKIYHLSTCDTCKKILKELDVPSSFILQDIKEEPITEVQLEEMKELSGNYEALFSKRARLYKERELKNEALTEDRFKNLILEHYTFLKRPVIIYNDQIFAGNAKKNVEEAKTAIHG
ncbi:arsenate reductase family protein [Gillisia limnaea]|uniref:Arsenate reductase like protein n=1 Tax=Gillisia limnaea (strain DSM 15749 / LMG 21470 / R-8282) TaxID=865937 RepID=H2BUY2_GILLR|nr:ArsC/Spx/MgsR family protein [Gillisia limnaea]EHQ02830.1 arsenate reductase like protein [Gillisia limnaea DSM 15749]